MFRPTFDERHDELDLVMHVRRLLRIRKLAREIEVVGFFWKKNGGSRSGSCPISMAWAA
jgi:hypothetical protein